MPFGSAVVAAVDAVFRLRDEISPQLATLQANLQATGKRWSKIGDDMARTGDRMSKAVTAPIVGLGTLTAYLADAQLQAERSLGAALRFAGNEDALGGLQEYAKELQGITTVGDETTLSMLQVATSMGLAPEQAKVATREAIALSKGFGIAERSAIRYTAGLAEGDTTMLNRYIPTLRNVEDQSERVALAHKLLGDAFQIAVEEAEAGLGPWKQIKNELGDVGEEYGVVVLEGIEPLIGNARSLVKWLSSLSDEQKRWVLTSATVAAAIGPVLSITGRLISGAGSVIVLTGKIVGLVKVEDAATASTKRLSGALGKAGLVAAVGAASYAIGTKLQGILERNDLEWADVIDRLGLYGESLQDIRQDALANARAHGEMLIEHNAVRGSIERVAQVQGTEAEATRRQRDEALMLMGIVSDMGVAYDSTGDIETDFAFTVDETTLALQLQQIKEEQVREATWNLAIAVQGLGVEYDSTRDTVEDFVFSLPDGPPSGWDNFVGSILGGLENIGTGMGIVTRTAEGLQFTPGAFLENMGSGFVEGLGQMLAGGISSIISKGLSLLVSGLGKLFGALFKKANVADHAREFFGLELSEGLTQAIEQARDEVEGRDIEAAIRLKLGAIFEEKGIGDVGELQRDAQLVTETISSLHLGHLTVKQTVDAMIESEGHLLRAVVDVGGGWTAALEPVVALMGEVQAGNISAAEGARFLDGIWGDLTATAATLGVEGSAAVRAIIEQTRTLGIESDEITKFVLPRANEMAAGASAMIDAGLENQRQARMAATLLRGAFDEMLAQGVPVTQIVASLGEEIQAVTASGFDLGASWDQLAGFAAKLADEGVQKVTDRLAGMNQGILAMAELGLPGLQEQSKLFGDELDAAYIKLQAQGLTAEEAIVALKPHLETIARLQAEYGITVDAGTQALLDQARAQGTLKEEGVDMAEATVQGLGGILERFDALLAHLGISTKGFFRFETSSTGNLQAVATEAEATAATVETEFEAGLKAAGDASVSFKDQAIEQIQAIGGQGTTTAGELAKLFNRDFTMGVRFDVGDLRIPGGRVGLETFQTVPGQWRVVPGSPSELRPIGAHGGEVVGRPGPGGNDDVVDRLDRLERTLLSLLPDSLERAVRHGIQTAGKSR